MNMLSSARLFWFFGFFRPVAGRVERRT